MKNEDVSGEMEQYGKHPLKMYIEVRMMDNLFRMMTDNANKFFKDIETLVMVLAHIIITLMRAIKHMTMLVGYPITKTIWVLQISKAIRENRYSVGIADEKPNA